MSGGCPLTTGGRSCRGDLQHDEEILDLASLNPLQDSGPNGTRGAEIEWGEIIILPDKVVLLRQRMGQVNSHRRLAHGSSGQQGFGEDRDNRSVLHAGIKCDSLNEEAAAGIDRRDLRGWNLHGKQSPRRSVSDPKGVAVAEVIDVD